MKSLIFIMIFYFGINAFAQDYFDNPTPAGNVTTTTDTTNNSGASAQIQDDFRKSEINAGNAQASAADQAKKIDKSQKASGDCQGAQAAVVGSEACEMDKANSSLNIAAVLAHAFLTKEASDPVAACHSISQYATVANTALTLYQAGCVDKINACLSTCSGAVSADKVAVSAGGVDAADLLKKDQSSLVTCQTYEKGIPNQTTAITALVAANTNASSACAAYEQQVANEKSAYCTMNPNAATCVTAATEADCASGASTSPQCVCIRAGTCSTVSNPTTTGTPAAGSAGSSASSAASLAAQMAAQAEAEGMPLDNTNPLAVNAPKAGTGLAGVQPAGGGGGGGNMAPALSGAKKGAAAAAKDAKAMYAGYITNNGSGSIGGNNAAGYNNSTDPNKRAVFGGKLGSGTMDLAGAKPGYNPSRKPSSFTTGPDGLTGPNGNLFGKVRNQFADQVAQGNHFIGLP